MRTRLRGLGVGGVQARTFHAAAMKQLQLLLAARGRRRRRRGCSTTPSAWWPTPPPAPGCGPAPPSSATCSPSSTGRPARLVGPEDYPARRPAPGGRGRTTRPSSRRSTTPTATSSRRRAPPTSTTCCCSPPARSRSTPASPRSSAPRYRSFVVDEYQDVTPLQQRLLDAWLGGRDDLCVVGDAHQTIYSFTGATPVLPARASAAASRAAQEVRLVRDYRSTPQVVGLANAVIAKAADDGVRPGSSCSPSSRPGRRRSSPSTTTSRPRPPPSPPAAARSSRPAPRPARSPCSTASTPRARPTRRRSPTPACPTSCAAASASSTARRSREALLLLRGAVRVADDDAPDGLADADGRRPALRPVLGPRRARRPAPAPPASAGSRWPRCTGSPATSRATVARRRPARAGRRARGARVRAARAERRGRHARLAARRQGPGVGRGLPRRARRRHAAARARREARPPSRRSAGCSTSASPAPATVLQLSWALSRSPGGRGSRRPSRFLDGLHAAVRRARGGARRGAGGPPRALRARDLPGLRRRPDRRRSTASSAAAATARPTATSSCSTRCASGGPSAPRASGSRRTACSPTRRSPPSPSSGPAASPRSSRSRGSARRSWTSSATRCCRSSVRPREPVLELRIIRLHGPCGTSTFCAPARPVPGTATSQRGGGRRGDD